MAKQMVKAYDEGIYHFRVTRITLDAQGRKRPTIVILRDKDLEEWEKEEGTEHPRLRPGPGAMAFFHWVRKWVRQQAQQGKPPLCMPLNEGLRFHYLRDGWTVVPSDPRYLQYGA